MSQDNFDNIDNPDNHAPAFWRDNDGNDRAHAFNFYRFCPLLEQQM